ncbi:sigma-70 family RNA polymerase sigma factor [Oscillospiraceae bacterium OttesenSCG-928-G22]|nr:sigma-70 family RNA polymerase sigma factor [Oscillospiraceae bacterium OttesenSCG-928-G22]
MTKRSLFDTPDKSALELHHLLKGDENNEKLDKIRTALFESMKLNLTDKQREAIILHYSDGVKMSEIAKMWNVSPSAVSRHISRGLSRIQKSVIVP